MRISVHNADWKIRLAGEYAYRSSTMVEADVSMSCIPFALKAVSFLNP